jgi:hypothetical protein
MKTKIAIISLLVITSLSAFGQAKKIDATATVDTINKIATIHYVDSVANDIVAGELDLTGYVEWGDTLTKIATHDDIIDLITLSDAQGEIADSLLNYVKSSAISEFITIGDVQSEIADSLLNYAKLSALTGFLTGDDTLSLDARINAIEIGGGTGSVTSVAVSGGTTGLTTSGGPITTSGTITQGGTLAVANGGTGVTTSTGTGSTVLSSSPALTGTPTVPTAVTGTNTTQAASTAFVIAQAAGMIADSNAALLNNAVDGVALADSSGTAAGSYVTGYDFTTGLAGKPATEDVVMLADTIPIFTFGLGGGLAADTAAFNDNAIAGSFFNAGSDTIHVTSLRGVLAEGSGTETVGVQVSWHATFKSGSATNLNTEALTITSTTTGDVDTSFANAVIPPGVFVWCTISATSAGNKPSLLILQLSGYKTSTY